MLAPTIEEVLQFMKENNSFFTAPIKLTIPDSLTKLRTIKESLNKIKGPEKDNEDKFHP